MVGQNASEITCIEGLLSQGFKPKTISEGDCPYPILLRHGGVKSCCAIAEYGIK
jgi:hypothetical protein